MIYPVFQRCLSSINDLSHGYLFCFRILISKMLQLLNAPAKGSTQRSRPYIKRRPIYSYFGPLPKPGNKCRLVCRKPGTIRADRIRADRPPEIRQESQRDPQALLRRLIIDGARSKGGLRSGNRRRLCSHLRGCTPEISLEISQNI